MASNVEPVRSYLKNLEIELKRCAVDVREEAICDAREFLLSEYQRLDTRSDRLTDAEIYRHFVITYGSPEQVAAAYAEQEQVFGNSIGIMRTSRPLRWLGVAATFLLAFCATVGLCVAAYLNEPPTLSPFTEVRYEENDRVVVRVDGELYVLISLDDLPTKQILKAARDHFGDRWEKRFAEDLVEVLWTIGHRPGRTVKLTLRDRANGQIHTVPNAAMTEANRQAVWLARNADFAPRRSESLTTEEAARIIDQFTKIVAERWSYYPIAAQEVDAAVSKLRERFPARVRTDELALELQKVIAQGIDGHAEVSGWRLDEGYLPFLIEPTADRYVAFLPDRTGFVDDDYPYITAIDGRPIGEWCAAAASIVPRGSPGYVQRHVVRYLRNIQHWRKALDLRRSETLDVELASNEGQTIKMTLPIADSVPTYGIWPNRESRVLSDGVGYLRLPSMDDSAADEIKEWMPKFRDTKGLVVDVRDNGGGSRDALQWLFSFLVAEDEPPCVVNCAKYRLYKGFPDDHLAARYMYRAGSNHWNNREKRAIESFRKAFEPEHELPAEQFSDWHYMVLGRLDAPLVYHFSKPVVVLTNAKCFSATDVFLAALRDRPNVTLMGSASGGGSARAITSELAGTPIALRLGSMVSFTASGQLFDRRGIAPDVQIDPVPEYFIDGTDNVLEQAIALVLNQ